MSNHDNIIPGSLVSLGSSSDGDCELVLGLIHYIVAAIVFFVYAKQAFSLGIAILYSVFWEIGLVYTILS